MDKSINENTPPRLGMALEQYLLAYRNAIMAPPDWFGDLRYDRSRADIEKVSALGRDGLYDLDDISISTLRSILHYAYSPTGRWDLGSPALISGCIKILKSIRGPDRESFLDFELGYVCLQIISIGLGGCLLRRGQDLGFSIYSFPIGSEVPKIYEVSVETSQMVVELASHLGGRQHDPHNCILGWSACPEHKKGSSLVSPSDAGALLDVLYMDRHLFLRVMRSNYLPGLSAVTFMLWRYVTYQRFLKGPKEAQRYFGPLKEVFWRCFLVATPHEQASFYHMYQWDRDLWPQHSQVPTTTAKLHNSTVVIGTFIDRLAPAAVAGVSVSSIPPVSLSDLVNSFKYVGNYFQLGCEDLVAGYFGTVIEQMWCINSQQESDPRFNSAIGTSMLNQFCTILELLRHRTANKTIALQVIDVTIKTDLLNLIARAILSLVPHPSMDRHSDDYSTNAHVLKGAEEFHNDLSKLVPAQVMSERFEFYYSDWWKVTRHLGFLGQAILPREQTPIEVQSFFYALCLEFWGRVGKAIRHPGAELPARFCHYTRCPDPWVVAGIVHGCSNCSKVEYCSARCRGMDWVHDHERQSHRVLCSRYKEEDG